MVMAAGAGLVGTRQATAAPGARFWYTHGHPFASLMPFGGGRWRSDPSLHRRGLGCFLERRWPMRRRRTVIQVQSGFMGGIATAPPRSAVGLWWRCRSGAPARCWCGWRVPHG